MITQGTWEASKHATPDYAPQYGIYADGEQNDLCTVKSENAKDDARLIAAAPNLLEACKLAATALKDHLQYDTGESLERDGFNAVTQAIAKAEKL